MTMSIKNTILGMISNKAGGISSKIIVGSFTYIILVIAIIVLCFVNPNFGGINDIVDVTLITSASLLGLTTVENIKDSGKNISGGKNSNDE